MANLEYANGTELSNLSLPFWDADDWCGATKEMPTPGVLDRVASSLWWWWCTIIVRSGALSRG